MLGSFLKFPPCSSDFLTSTEGTVTLCPSRQVTLRPGNIRPWWGKAQTLGWLARANTLYLTLPARQLWQQLLSPGPALPRYRVERLYPKKETAWLNSEVWLMDRDNSQRDIYPKSHYIPWWLGPNSDFLWSLWKLLGPLLAGSSTDQGDGFAKPHLYLNLIFTTCRWSDWAFSGLEQCPQSATRLGV